MILFVTDTPKRARYTGIFAGTFVALYIAFEAPYSGMSINPARTVASALPSGVRTAGWIFFVAPIAGMLLAWKFAGRCSKARTSLAPNSITTCVAAAFFAD